MDDVILCQEKWDDTMAMHRFVPPSLMKTFTSFVIKKTIKFKKTVRRKWVLGHDPPRIDSLKLDGDTIAAGPIVDGSEGAKKSVMLHNVSCIKRVSPTIVSIDVADARHRVYRVEFDSSSATAAFLSSCIMVREYAPIF